MTFSIQGFTSQHNKRNGYLKSKAGKVIIPTAPALMGDTEMLRDMEFYIQDFTLPGYTLNSGNVSRYGYGPVTSRPFGPNFNPVNLLILADGEGGSIDFWNNWMSLIVPHNTIQNGMQAYGKDTGDSVYLISYRKDYVVDLYMDIYDENGNVVTTYGLRDAFPSAVSDINMSWGAVNDVVQMQVQLQYTDWTKDGNGNTTAPTTQTAGQQAFARRNFSGPSFT